MLVMTACSAGNGVDVSSANPTLCIVDGRETGAPLRRCGFGLRMVLLGAALLPFAQNIKQYGIETVRSPQAPFFNPVAAARLCAAPFLCYTRRHDGVCPLRFGHRVVRAANYRPGFRVTSGSAEDRDCRAFFRHPQS